MSTVLSDTRLESNTSQWMSIPPRMRILFITGFHRTGGWLAEAFAADSASEILLEEAIGMTAGLARLRDEVFDAVLISHAAEELDALELLDALRAGNGDEQPIIVLGEQSEQEMNALCYEVGADAYVCVNTTTTRALIWQMARSVERHQLIGENRRLTQKHNHRLELEHNEAKRLLEQQRAFISVGPGQDHSPKPGPICLPDRLVRHYQELLRAYVIMGSGNLSTEMFELASLFVAGGVSARQVMELHLKVLEEIIEGLGSRSSRHVMNRADLLLLEVMFHLSDGFQLQLRCVLHPPTQRVLPGFEITG